MDVVAIIPARFGSSRFPGKPLAPIAGKPLLQWVYEAAGRVPALSAVYVATDDARIAALVKEMGGNSIMTSSSHLSGSDRLAEAARILSLAPEDIIVNIQGDQIVFPLPLISGLVECLQGDPSAAMATAMRALADPGLAADPNVVKVVFTPDHYALYFSRAAIPHYREPEAPRVFFKHVGIYVYRQEFLQQFVKLPPGRWEQAEKLEQLRALEFGFKIKLVETTEETLEVDTPEEAHQAGQFLAGHRR